MKPEIIHGDTVTLDFCVAHGTVIIFIFMSTGLCFVTFPRKGGAMAQTHVVQSLS